MRLMVAADLVRAAALVLVAIAGLAGDLPLWSLAVVAFVLSRCASYFDPAYGAVLPALAGRDSVQAANALVRASADALWLGGSAIAAALLAFAPLSAFFGINAASFGLSALLLSGLRGFDRGVSAEGERPRVREAFTILPPHPWLASAVAALGVAVTISSGTWIVGAPELVRRGLHGGAATFSPLIVAYALGGAHATGLLLMSPVFAVAAARSVFAGAALAIPLVGLLCFAYAARAARTAAPT